jgi:hypothetical protein
MAREEAEPTAPVEHPGPRSKMLFLIKVIVRFVNAVSMTTAQADNEAREAYLRYVMGQ